MTGERWFPALGAGLVIVAVLALSAAGFLLRWPLAAPLVAAFRLLRWGLTTAYAAAPVLAVGLLLTRRVFRIPGALPPGWELLAAWGLGWGVVAVLGTAMLACGLYHEAVWSVTALLANLTLVAVLASQRWRPVSALWASAREAWQAWRGREGPGAGIWGVAIALCVASAVLLASLPPDTRDELVYHLAVPRFWSFQHDWWVPLDNVHWLFPGNAEVIWGYGLAVGGIHVPRLLTLCFGLATLALLAGILDESGCSRWTARLSLLFLLLAPLSVVLLGTCGAEWILLFFLFLGWRAARQFLAGGVAAAFLAAVAWGFCLGTKYTAFVVVVGLALEWLVALLLAGSKRRAAVALAALAAASALLAGGWLARNWRLTGDPLYPLGSEILGTRAVGSDTPSPDVTSLLDYAKVRGPWRLAPWVYHATADPLIDQRLHLGWPLLLVGVVALGWRRARTLPWFAATLAILLLLRHTPAPRAYLPAFALAWLFLPEAIRVLERRPWTRHAVSLAAGVLILSSLPWFHVIVTRYNPATQQFLLGIIGDEELLRRNRVITPVVSFVRSLTPVDARVWVWGGEQTFYLDRWARASSFLDKPLFLDWFERYGPEGFTRKLAESRVDLILVETANCALPPTSVHTEVREWPIAPDLQPVIATWMRDNLREIARDGSRVLFAVNAKSAG